MANGRSLLASAESRPSKKMGTARVPILGYDFIACYDLSLRNTLPKNQAKFALAKSQLAREARKVSTNLGRALR
jgi:hypothetical protein